MLDELLLFKEQVAVLGQVQQMGADLEVQQCQVGVILERIQTCNRFAARWEPVPQTIVKRVQTRIWAVALDLLPVGDVSPEMVTAKILFRIRILWKEGVRFFITMFLLFESFMSLPMCIGFSGSVQFVDAATNEKKFFPDSLNLLTFFNLIWKLRPDDEIVGPLQIPAVISDPMNSH